MKRAASAASLAACALAAAGCAGAGDYLGDRGSDFADIFLFRGGTGFLANATVKATDGLHAGLGFASVHVWGFKGRHPQEVRGDDLGFVVGHVEDHFTGPREPYGDSCYFSPLLFGEEATDVPVMDRFFLEARATVVLVTLDLGVNPAELLDFLAGWATVDFAGDDVPKEDPYPDKPPPAPEETGPGAPPPRP